jgi:hypothetical protein
MTLPTRNSVTYFRVLTCMDATYRMRLSLKTTEAVKGQKPRKSNANLPKRPASFSAPTNEQQALREGPAVCFRGNRSRFNCDVLATARGSNGRRSGRSNHQGRSH